jgi:hypothetical protein
MLPAAAALLASLALQAGVTQYTASLYTQARYDTSLDALAPLKSSALEVDPSLGLRHEARAFTFGIAYYPRLLMVIGSPPPQFFNQASLSFALHPDPALRLTADASATYGTYDFRLQSTAPPGQGPSPGQGQTPGQAPGQGTIQPIPLVSTAKYVNAAGALGFECASSARTRVAGVVSYLVEGGADAPSRTLLPLRRGPTIQGTLDWNLPPHDTLTTTFTASYFAFLAETAVAAAAAIAPNAWSAQASETWQHTFGPPPSAGQLRLGLGVGAIGDAIGFPRLTLRRAVPVAEVGFQQGFGQPAVQLTVGARVAPFADFTTTATYERVTAFASLGWQLQRDWGLATGFSAGVALEGAQHGQATGTGQLTATWTAAPWAQLSAGLSSLWQEAGTGYAASTFRQLTVSLGATFRQSGRL